MLTVLTQIMNDISFVNVKKFRYNILENMLTPPRHANLLHIKIQFSVFMTFYIRNCFPIKTHA